MAAGVHGGRDEGKRGIGGAEGLLEEVLSWDIDAINPGNTPCYEKTLRELPSAFGSTDEYARRYEQLLLEEIRCQIEQALAGLPSAIVLTAYDESSEPASMRERGDGKPMRALSIDVRRKGSCLYSVAFSLDERDAARLHDGDLLIVRAEMPEGERLESPERVHTLACVDRRDEKHTVLTRMILPEQPRTSKVGVRVEASRTRAVRARLSQSSSLWKLQHLGSMSTAIREWRAVGALPSLPFCDVILRPGSYAHSVHSDRKQSIRNGFSSARRHRSSKASYRNRWRAPQALMQRLQNNYNKSQLCALKRVLDPTQINLIQGPPGTGKTRTILALLSLALHAAPGSGGGVADLSDRKDSVGNDANTHAASQQPQGPAATRKLNPASKPPSEPLGAMPWLRGIHNPRDDPPDANADPLPANDVVEPIILGNRSERSAHILVCAPSNSALDEVAQRLLGQGILDSNGQLYEPKCVRVGVRCMQHIRRIFLEEIVSHAASTNHPAEKDKIRAEVLDSASIVFSTLSYAGAAPFARIAKPFDAVIVDESTQATEPSNLVPLLQGCKQLFLVGDPSQLPATVISNLARKKGLSSSMFERFRHAGYPCDLLSEQHRMHPEIRRFPSREFYGAALTDAPGMHEQCKRDWHQHRLFSPFLMLDVVHGEQQRTSDGNSTSLFNEAEAQLATTIAKRFVKLYGGSLREDPLAIITPYRAQMRRIQALIEDKLDEQYHSQVDVSTIDGFQGRETEIVIFSVVRTPTESGSIGFVADDRRMNVGLTRARATLIVLGHSRALADYDSWRRMVSNALRRSCYQRVDEYASRQPVTRI